MRTSRGRRGIAVLAPVALAALVLTGCAASDGLAERYGNGQGYISGDGAYLEIPVAERGAPVEFSGPTVDGGTTGSADLAGSVAVINFWYAGCPPCRLEAPDLAALSAELDDVQFLGVNVYDGPDVARTFDEEFGIGYPSILDVTSGMVQYAFAATVAPNAVPTTIVLDREGRVAARVSGLLRDPAILRTMVETVQAEA
ncbi:MAG TPA: TlpA disulfide reductase family protein [Microbacteriaceae bacterium]|nr:TlpA disulfide reductase family protein [Microbacteriaceae bacterium]